MSEISYQKRQPPFAKARIPSSWEVYDGKELQPPVGISPARLKAFTLPSRWGQTLKYPDGTIEILNDGK